MSGLWFSYDVDGVRRDYPDCHFEFSSQKNDNDIVRITVHRQKHVTSHFRGRVVKIDSVLELRMNDCDAEIINGNQVLLFRLKNTFQRLKEITRCEIWKTGLDTAGELQRIIHEFGQAVERTTQNNDGIEPASQIDNPINPIFDLVMPVIYQPELDSKKNYLRELHCCSLAGYNEMYEISLVFNDEQLRKNWLFNTPYKLYRKIRYGRVKDIETFQIHVKNGKLESFIFRNIHSGASNIYHDNIHGDKPPAPSRKIRRFYQNKRHPKVYINTSNHAMAEFDTNMTMWKWEYKAWEADSPVKSGWKSRKQLDGEL